MIKSYEVTNKTTGHSLGFYPVANATDAVLACCNEAGYISIADAERTMGRNVQLVASRIVVVDAAPYSDADDSLQAVADAYAVANGLGGWDLAPRWEHGASDSLRESIILTIPDNA